MDELNRNLQEVVEMLLEDGEPEFVLWIRQLGSSPGL
jgi:hypothetical protein